MKIRYLLVFILFNAIGINSFSQNLIANGSFEDVNICKEANAPCSPSAWKTTSPFLLVYGSEKSNKFVGITIFNTSKKGSRKYLQTKLLCPLQKDKTYKFSIKLRPQNVIIESIGVLFSDSSLFYNTDRLIKKTPTIDLKESYSKIPNKKKRSWVKLDLEYKANGNEKFLIIGNFQSDGDQKRIFLSKPAAFTNYDYDIDDVELVPMEKIELCSDYQLTKDLLYSLTERHPFTKENLFGEDNLKPIVDKVVIDTISLGSVFFEFNSAEINSTGKQTIDSIFRNLKNGSIESIKIFGFTDSIGGKDYNMDLSNKRANAIKQILNEYDLTPYISEVKGFGDSFPIASNSEESGRIKNRRVEVIIRYVNNNKINH
jgi:outer membrane protein OmpA-like peptidoglycan-associated protein